ncbi:hypothetical protein BABINDRAFT_165978 [Babjeviella inositovora NRRL Y-12698]|uniref:VanZ-like domain-containing protein n=1 Tax=Babjeviella inositovora NRRL Y-12698 TaxID=984486 RepID=A0A1E3QUD1_9ASCO|nr:uncharacterized protein BABINDRAFT_165978 [Babjeviella inositovora NRRL Y-12698]ODQ81286.1 hypothetical protein BABINDRAFT_165978 [Babjeviella inositovora NRRL Y-12698]
MKIRIPFAVSFVFLLALAAYLGLADLHYIHDKVLHFVMFFLCTANFYWIFDTRSVKLLFKLTFGLCTVAASIGSEFAQHLINPKRVFDLWDIAANVSGSILALLGSVYYHIILLQQLKRARYLALAQPTELQDINVLASDVADFEIPSEEASRVPTRSATPQ